MLRGRDCIRRNTSTERSRGSRTRAWSGRIRGFDARSRQDSIELCDQGFLRAAKKIIYHLPKRLGAGLVGRNVCSIGVGATNLSPLYHAFASKPVHDRHDRGVGARATLGEAIADFAHGSFAHGP